MRLARERLLEHMDQRDADPCELRRSLRDLERVNRWLGGRRAALTLILDLARRVPATPVRVLDLASGGADIPLALVAAARRQRIDIQVTATDIHPITLAYARGATLGEDAVNVAEADALDLRYPDDAFDLVAANTMLHHFDREGAMQVLREMDRVGRYGLVVSDLARSRLALAGAALLAATVWRSHPITRHDGPASARAAFTPEELATMADECLEGRWEVRRHALFRLSLVADRTVAPARA